MADNYRVLRKRLCETFWDVLFGFVLGVAAMRLHLLDWLWTPLK